MTVPVLDLWIDGRRTPSRSGRAGDVFDPATGEVVRRAPFASAEEIDAAVAAARAAFPAWRDTPPLRRARILARLRELLEEHRDALAKLVSEEHGKTLADAAGSVQRGIEVVEFVTGAPHLLKGERAEDAGRGIDTHSALQPLGVCAGVTPFNFPAMVPLWMFPVAIACGNTFVLKPSEKVPSTSLRMAELAKEAGLPDGVLNVVPGDREAVDALLAHPDVAAISPPWPRTISREMNRPRPRPEPFRLFSSGGRENGSKRCARTSGGMAGPRLHTRSTHVPASPASSTRTGAPPSPWSRAFETRFETSCSSRSGSHSPARSPSAAIGISRSGLAAESSSTARRTISSSCAARRSMGRPFPSRVRVYERRSAMIRAMRPADERIRAAFVRMLEDDPIEGSRCLAAFGDPRSVADLARALDRLLAAPIGDCVLCDGMHLVSMAMATNLPASSLVTPIRKFVS